MSTDKPMDFFYNLESEQYILNQLESEEDLLAAIHSGKGDPLIYPNYINLNVNKMFANLQPQDPTIQDLATGSNNLMFATAAQFYYFLKDESDPEYQEPLDELQSKIIDFCEDFNAQSDLVEFYMFTETQLYKELDKDIENNTVIIQMVIIIVAGYFIFFVGGCSPIHMRSFLAIMGLFSIGLSGASSFGFCCLVGLKVSSIHLLLPFILVGIGVDDMFVIVNAVEQTDYSLSCE